MRHETPSACARKPATQRPSPPLALLPGQSLSRFSGRSLLPLPVRPFCLPVKKDSQRTQSVLIFCERTQGMAAICWSSNECLAFLIARSSDHQISRFLAFLRVSVPPWWVLALAF